MAEWNALMNLPNAGEAFANAYTRARQMKQQEAMQREEMDARREDRGLRRQILERQTQMERVKEARSQLELMTRLLGSARDETSYQSARRAAQQAGLDISSVPPNFDPAWVENKRREAVALSGKAEQAATALEREYEFLVSKDPGLAEQYLRNRAEGSPIVANNGDGTFTIIPRSQIGRQSGAVPPPPPGFVIDDGGPTESPSGGFRP